MLAAFGQDLKHAVRLTAKDPLLSLAIVVTLALGVGLNAGVFTVIDGLLFRPRVAHDAATFFDLQAQSMAPQGTAPALPLVSLQDYRAFQSATSIRELAAWAPVHAGPWLPLLVTCNFFAVYTPARPILGRVLAPADCAAPGIAPVAVIGEELWRNRFGADPAVVGTTLALNGRDFTIVGVLPRDYDGRLRGPIWVPYTMAAAFFGGRSVAAEPATPWLLGLSGRLQPGASRPAAAAELRVIAQQQDTLAPGRQTTVRVTGGSMIETPAIRAMAVWIVPLVMGAPSLVLLIACLNVAVLMLSRAVARRREIAVRLSIGATRGRLVRMLMTESVLLAAMAGPPSVYLALIAPRVLKAITPTLPYYPFEIDRLVLGYLASATLFAGIAAGLAPALESLKPAVAPALHGEDAGGTNTRGWRTRDVLIAAQVALSLVLLVGAALFIRAERRIAANPGYETDHVLAVAPRVSVPPHTPQSAAAFYRSLQDRVGGISGVRSSAYADTAGSDDAPAAEATAVADANGAMATTAVANVSPEYFGTIGLGLVRGTTFSDANDRAAVVVSESFARSIWPDRDPIGERLHLAASPTRPLHVVGVAHDVQSLTGPASERTIYRPRAADALGDVLLVRFDGDERQTATAVRDAIARLDADAVSDPRTLTAIRLETADRFLRLVEMVVFLAGIGLLLAAVGVYGAVAFAVARRMKEIGIRIALGATRRDITTLVLWTGWKPILAGLTAGTAAALVAAPALARIFRNSPARIDPFDPVAYVTVALVLAAAGTLAMVGTCRRATSTDPARALHRD